MVLKVLTRILHGFTCCKIKKAYRLAATERRRPGLRQKDVENRLDFRLYPVRGTSAEDKSVAVTVLPAAHRDFRLRASPHRESGPLLKCSWKRDASLRRPDTYAEGARNACGQIDIPSRLEPVSKQDFQQLKPTGLFVFFLILSF